MFTGLIEAVGELVECKPTSAGFRLRIGSPLASELSPGDSLSVSGVCLTVILAEDRVTDKNHLPRGIRIGCLISAHHEVEAEDPMDFFGSVGDIVVQVGDWLYAEHRRDGIRESHRAARLSFIEAMTGLNDVGDVSDQVSFPVASQSRQGVCKYPMAALTNGIDTRQSDRLDVLRWPVRGREQCSYHILVGRSRLSELY